jgi:hypothetical protein
MTTFVRFPSKLWFHSDSHGLRPTHVALAAEVPREASGEPLHRIAQVGCGKITRDQGFTGFQIGGDSCDSEVQELLSIYSRPDRHIARAAKG